MRKYLESAILHTHETTFRLFFVESTKEDEPQIMIKHVNVYIVSSSKESITPRHERVFVYRRNDETLYSISSRKITVKQNLATNYALVSTTDREYTHDETLTKSQFRDYLAKRFTREKASQILYEIRLAMSSNEKLTDEEIEFKQKNVYQTRSAEASVSHVAKREERLAKKASKSNA